MEEKLSKLLKAVIILGIISVVAVVFRLWPIFFVALALFIGARIWLRILKAKVPNSTPKSTKRRRTQTKNGGISEQVSILVNTEYPNAKWVWAQSNTLKRVLNGEDIFIILNSAGGYRRAKVCITDNAVSAIEYMKAPTRVVTEQVQVNGITESDPIEEPSENYELMAYEWVEAHINDLNERLNETVGRGNSDYLLSANELPIPESWESVCNELKRAGVSDAIIVQDGIKIKLI